MTNKEKTIKACKKLIEKYRSPEGKTFFAYDECPLCDIYYQHCQRECSGGPLANKKGMMGCDDFKSFIRASDVSGIVSGASFFYDGRVMAGAFRRYETRARFFEKIIPILKGMPDKRFTANGWKFTREISREW